MPYTGRKKQTACERIKTPAVIGAIINLGYLERRMTVSCGSSTARRSSTSTTEWSAAGGRGELRASNHSTLLEAFFSEGERIYPGAGIREKTHVQICVRNPNCIKGYFSPRQACDEWRMP